jgi:hypothetical protein
VKRITMVLTVADDYLYSDTARKIKTHLAESALSGTAIFKLDLVSVETRIGTVRKGK